MDALEPLPPKEAAWRRAGRDWQASSKVARGLQAIGGGGLGLLILAASKGSDAASSEMPAWLALVVGAFAAELLVLLWHVLRAPGRQRDDLRLWAERESDRQRARVAAPSPDAIDGVIARLKARKVSVGPNERSVAWILEAMGTELAAGMKWTTNWVVDRGRLPGKKTVFMAVHPVVDVLIRENLLDMTTRTSTYGTNERWMRLSPAGREVLARLTRARQSHPPRTPSNPPAPPADPSP